MFGLVHIFVALAQLFLVVMAVLVVSFLVVMVVSFWLLW